MNVSMKAGKAKRISVSTATTATNSMTTRCGDADYRGQRRGAKVSDDYFTCKNGHRCTEEEIPEEGLDIYCPTCFEPLDLKSNADYRETDYKSMYFELIMQVERKVPGESRFETAKRLIREGERGNTGCATAHDDQE